MNTYVCTATFTDTRIKPRVVVVETAGFRSDARKAGRKEIAAAIAGKGWEIAMVTAIAQADVAKPAGKVVGKVKAKSTRGRKVADPNKKAAWAEALAMGCTDPYSDAATLDTKADFWDTYKAIRAAQRAGADKAETLTLVSA